jgi:hypothetical protein
MADLTQPENRQRLVADLLQEERIRLWQTLLTADCILQLWQRPGYPGVIEAFYTGYAQAKGKRIWADKDPGNMTRIPQLNRWFPGCRMVRRSEPDRQHCGNQPLARCNPATARRLRSAPSRIAASSRRTPRFSQTPGGTRVALAGHAALHGAIRQLEVRLPHGRPQRALRQFRSIQAPGRGEQRGNDLTRCFGIAWLPAPPTELRVVGEAVAAREAIGGTAIAAQPAPLPREGSACTAIPTAVQFEYRWQADGQVSVVFRS